MQPTGMNKDLGIRCMFHCDFQIIRLEYLQSQSVECMDNWKVVLDPVTDRQPLLPVN